MIDLPFTLDNKPLITKNGEVIVDLTAPSMKNSPSSISITGAARVSESELCRPDILSKIAFGNTVGLEILLKFNGISNPFSMEEGDIIAFPHLYEAAGLLYREPPSDTTNQDIRNAFVDKSKYPQKNHELDLFNKRDKINPTLDIQPELPPNFADFGESQIKVDNNKIVLGPDVSNCNCDPIPKSDFLTSLIKNRIKNK